MPRKLEDEPIIATDEDAIAYETMVERYKPIYESRVKRAMSFGPRGDILDIGTGTGLIPIILAKSGNYDSVTTIDASPLMIAMAKKKAKEAEVETKIKFVLGDALRLPFPDRSFDIILSNYTLHNFAEPMQFFSEIQRVLKPGGTVVVQDLKRPNKFFLPILVWIFGSFLGTSLRKQYCESIKAALSKKEWHDLHMSLKKYGYRLVPFPLTSMMSLEIVHEK